MSGERLEPEDESHLGVQDDTSEPRPSESLDEERLRNWLADRLPNESDCMSVRQFTRGKANLTYLLSFPSSGNEYVLRRPPHGDLPAGAHDISREYRVLRTLWEAFPLAPRALAYCENTDVIGAPFMIMERRHGAVVQDEIPPVFGGGTDPEANRRISQVVVDTLGELHAVDPAHAGLGDLGRPDGFLDRQITGWTHRMLETDFANVDHVTQLSEWLTSRVPLTTRVSIVHNDWRLDNLALDPADPSTCTAVYDWDMCTRGDPMADLGTLMSAWYDVDEETPEFAPMPTKVPGFMSRSEAIERYCTNVGADIDSGNWYVVFGTFKMAVVLQQIFQRWKSGATDDDRFASMGESARQLLDLAYERRVD